MQPHQFPRRILLCVTGLSPQIVTETLYALAVDTHGRPPFVPTEIHLITTSEGAEQARLALLAPDRDQFGRLCRDYGLSGIRFDAGAIETIRDTAGQPMSDIRTPADNEAAADAITRRVSEFTRDGNAALHVSLAGGRKTMSFFLGYALSLYGRPQDRLSHVLVSPRFETHRDFYFKPRRPMTLHDRDGLEMSTEAAEIALAEIPFVPLREGLHKPLLARAAGYAETVAAWRRSSGSSELVIDPARMRVSWAGVSLKLTPAQLAVYVWLADRRLRDGDGDGGWAARDALASDSAVQSDLVASARVRCGPLALATQTVEDFFLSGAGLKRISAKKREWIGPHISRINARIEDELDALAVRRIGIATEGGRSAVRYRLAAEPGEIRFARS